MPDEAESHQTITKTIYDVEHIFGCPRCGYYFVVIPTDTACGVLHGPDDCCHINHRRIRWEVIEDGRST